MEKLLEGADEVFRELDQVERDQEWWLDELGVLAKVLEDGLAQKLPQRAHCGVQAVERENPKVSRFMQTRPSGEGRGCQTLISGEIKGNMAEMGEARPTSSGDVDDESGGLSPFVRHEGGDPMSPKSKKKDKKKKKRDDSSSDDSEDGGGSVASDESNASEKQRKHEEHRRLRRELREGKKRDREAAKEVRVM